MRVGIVVDGIGERSALPKLYAQIRTPHVLLDPIKRDIQPMAPLGQIVRAAVEACRVLAVKRIDFAVIVIDLEQRNECPGTLAQRLQERIQGRVAELGIQVAVVVKVRTFENWLVSDLECLSRLSGQFPECQHVRQAVSADAADRVDALAILQDASGRRRSYHVRTTRFTAPWPSALTWTWSAQRVIPAPCADSCGCSATSDTRTRVADRRPGASLGHSTARPTPVAPATPSPGTARPRTRQSYRRADRCGRAPRCQGRCRGHAPRP